MKTVTTLAVAAAACMLGVSATAAAGRADRASAPSSPKHAVYRLTAKLGTARNAKGAKREHGRLTGRIAIKGKAGTLHWTLSFEGLTGKVRAADIELVPSGKVLVPLCAPCRSGNAGSLSGPLGTHSQVLQAILAGHTEVAVQTKKRSRGGQILGVLHASAVHGSAAVIVSTRKIAGLGRVLVDSRGRTLYMFVPDEHARVTCVSTCAAVWPPLELPGGDKPSARNGVRASLLGSDPNPAGGRVVTYAGWPLYTYVADKAPGSAGGQALKLNGGYWYVLAPSGKLIRTKPDGPGKSATTTTGSGGW